MKALAHWLSLKGSRLWIGVHPATPTHPPHPQFQQASEIKQTFYSTNFASLLGFQKKAGEPHFQLYIFLHKLKDFSKTSPVAQTVKRLPTVRETWVQFLGREDLLEKEMVTQSSTLAWKILWTEEPGRLQSMGSQRKVPFNEGGKSILLEEQTTLSILRKIKQIFK